MDSCLSRPLPAGDVALVPAQQFVTLRPEVPASFSLIFPGRWRPREALNPHAAAIEQETLAWLRAYDIGRDAAEAERLRKFNCAMYGGYSLPVADHESALLVTQFICLWLFWDDMTVEEELGWDVEEIARALVEREGTVSSRYAAAWADIGRRLRANRSASWLAALGATMRGWMENAKLETAMARGFKAGQCPEFTRALDCRTISIGMYPTFHLIEYAEGIELPASFHAHPIVVELKRLASRLVGLGNDLGGLAKDIDQRWLNLVLILSERAGLPIEVAFQQVVDLHNADVEVFDTLCARLPSWGPEIDADIARWLRAVRYNVRGFTLWESTAERYQELRAIVNGKALVAPVDPVSRS